MNDVHTRSICIPLEVLIHCITNYKRKYLNRHMKRIKMSHF